MIVWLLTNLSLTLLALAFASWSVTAPHRLRFLACFTALCSWLVPWSQIGRLVPTRSALSGVLQGETVMQIGAGLPRATGNATTESLTAIAVANADIVLLVVTLVGFLLFLFSAIGYARLVKRMSLESISGTHLWAEVTWGSVRGSEPKKKPSLRIQGQVPGAITTGVVLPTIWVHEDLARDRGLGAALVHEYRHIRNHDNAYLWIITLIEKLFWWNPLLRYLSSRARQLQELSCDEACAKDLPNYRDTLEGLVLSLSGGIRQSYPQTPCIHHSRNFNVERLRALETRYAMKIRHYLGTGLLLIGSSIVLGWAAAQESPELETKTEVLLKPEPGPAPTDQVLRELEERTGEELTIPGFEADTTIEEAEELYRSLQLYVTLLERQYDNQEAIIESLRSELEAMQDETAD